MTAESCRAAPVVIPENSNWLSQAQAACSHVKGGLGKRQGTAIYQRLAVEAKEKLAAVEPLTAPEPDRRRIRAPEYDPLILERMKLGD